MKENEEKHFVQRFTFDIELERKSDAKPVQDRLSYLFNNRIQDMLGKLLDELDDPKYIVKIDTIEVNLGEITESQLEGSLYYMIKEALVRAIGKRVRSILDSPMVDSRDGGKMPLTPAKIELLTFFLEYGRVPAGGEVFKDSIEKIFQTLIRESPDGIRAMLSETLPNKPQVARRIVRQFGRETIESLIRLAAPAHLYFIQSQEQEIVDRAAEMIGYSRSTVREEVRVALFRYLFARPGQRFAIAAFRQEMKKILSERLGSPVESILKVVETEEDSSASIVAREELEKRQFRALIMRALRRGPASVPKGELIRAWEYFVRRAPENLRTIIKEAVDSPVPLVELLAVLPVPAIRLLVSNVVTQATETVTEVVVAVIAAHSTLQLGNDADARFIRAAYGALIYELASAGRISLRKEAIADALRKHLDDIPGVPKKLLAQWDELEIPGSRTPEQREKEEREAAIQRAREEAEEKEFLALIAKKRAGEEPSSEKEGLKGSPDGKESAETKEERIRKAREEFLKKRREQGVTEEPSEEEIQAELERMEREAKEAEEKEEGKEGESKDSSGREDGEEDQDSEWPLPISKEEAEAEIEASKRRARQSDDIVDGRPMEKRQPKLPESLFEGDEEEWRRRNSLEMGDMEDVTERFDLATETARVEYVMYFFRYGEDPWWAGNLRRRDIQSLVSRLVKDEPNLLIDASRELIFKTPPSVYPVVVERMIESLEEVQRLLYIEKLVPDLIGFFATTNRALSLFFEAKKSKLALPARIASAQSFAWFYPLQYVFQYYSSRPTSSGLLKFVLKEMASALGMEVAELVKELNEVAEKAIEKGERRFSPFRTLLPDPEDELVVPLPVPHPDAPEDGPLPLPEELRTRTPEAGDEKSGPVRQDVPQSEILPQAEEDTESADPEKRTPTRIPETELESEQDKLTHEQDKLEAETPPESKMGKESTELPEQEHPETEPQSDPGQTLTEEEITAQEKIDAEKRARGEVPESEVPARGEDDDTTSPVDREEWPEDEPEQDAPLVPALLDLLEDERESVRILEYYLRHGALPHQDSVRFSKSAFKTFLNEVMVKHERAYVQMLRNISDNLRVRLRLVGLGEEVAVQSLLHLNWMTGSGMQPFLEGILKLLQKSGAPVELEPVMEHAILYVTSSAGSSFKPVNYIKALFRYLERYYKVAQEDLVRFLIQKNEESSVSVKAILNEILEMIRLSVERRQTNKKPEKPDVPRYGNQGIPEDIEIFVQNAGMVLVWPFLYQFFQRLDLMTEERLFKDEESMEKAAHMLQYMVTAEQNAPEEALFLNKLLVGLPLDFPMHLEFEVSDVQKQITDSMLRSVADQWSMMKGAPPEQLRATFLVRDGIIKKDGDNWLLQVEKKGYDLVLKRLPWGLVQVRVPWLEYMINVEWG